VIDQRLGEGFDAGDGASLTRTREP
jgi:hypothetical protein